jgi:hypothetical protein
MTYHVITRTSLNHDRNTHTHTHTHTHTIKAQNVECCHSKLIITINPFGYFYHRHLMLAKVLSLALAPLGLDNKRTAINRVDNSVSAGECEMAPCTRIPERITTTGLHVVAREDVEVGNLLDLAAVGEARDAADVEDAQTGLVVGLEGEAVVHELVVVDHAGSGFVVAGDLGGFEVLDIPDICDSESILRQRSDRSSVGIDLALVELVVHDEMGLPVFVGDPALVSVGGADVRSAGDDLAGADALLVGDVVNGKGVLVVAVADVTSLEMVRCASDEICKIVTYVVLLVGSTVNNALSIVGVAVLGRATLNVRLGDVVGVDEDGATSAGVVATGASTAAESDDIVLLLVGTDSVGASGNTLGKIDPGNVLLDIEDLGALRVKLEELLHVEELDTVTDTLGANDKGVFEDLHLAPDDGVVLGGKATKVLELTLLGDLGESSTISLTNGDELAVFVGPSP